MKIKIDSFEAACKSLNQDSTLPEFPILSEREKKGMVAHYKLVMIIKALNGKWVPDWNNYNQNKYYPWFCFMVGRFVFNDVTYDCTISRLGSRLCCKDSKTAEFMGTNFGDLYNDYFLLE